jgi:kynureninase
MWRFHFLNLALLTVAAGCAREPISIREFITEDSAIVVLKHVRVIDGLALLAARIKPS